jgi:hypothetical protein
MGIFLICAECILHFAPGNSYQKYIRVLVGFMLLMQFIIPLRALFIGDELTLIEDQVNEFRILLESSNEIDNDVLILPNQEKMIENNVIAEVKTGLNNTLIKSGYNYIVTDVKLDKITYVIVKYDNITQGTAINNVGIDNVTIDKINLDEAESAEAGTMSVDKTKIAEELEQLFANAMETSEDYLEVVIID